MADAAMPEYSLVWTATCWGPKSVYGDVAAYHDYSAWAKAWTGGEDASMYVCGHGDYVAGTSAGAPSSLGV